MPNRLAKEKSPYLLQHAHNPVDWYPWGEEAFEKAASENKPIFLSIGYSTCHWCHVMERESFENDEIARVLNRTFRVHQSGSRRAARRRSHLHAVRAGLHRQRRMADVGVADAGSEAVFRRHLFSAGQSLRPAGIRARFSQSLAQAWQDDRAHSRRIRRAGARAASEVRRVVGRGRPPKPGKRRSIPGSSLSAACSIRASADSAARPNFRGRACSISCSATTPAPATEEALEMVLLTLREMAKGGMHDQLGGGFHRYSVDERWFVPHFEKMLYDQAQLAVSYLEAFQITRDGQYAAAARDILRLRAARHGASRRRILFGRRCR